jgi:hypothetical protein
MLKFEQDIDLSIHHQLIYTSIFTLQVRELSDMVKGGALKAGGSVGDGGVGDKSIINTLVAIINTPANPLIAPLQQIISTLTGKAGTLGDGGVGDLQIVNGLNMLGRGVTCYIYS